MHFFVVVESLSQSSSPFGSQLRRAAFHRVAYVCMSATGVTPIAPAPTHIDLRIRSFVIAYPNGHTALYTGAVTYSRSHDHCRPSACRSAHYGLKSMKNKSDCTTTNIFAEWCVVFEIPLKWADSICALL